MTQSETRNIATEIKNSMPVEKTILVICPVPYPPTNGTRIHIWGLILFFKQAGWRVILAVCSWEKILKANGEPGIDLPIDLEVHVIQRSSRWSAAKDPETVLHVQKLQQLIDHHRPSIVWCNYADLVPLASRLNLQRAQLWFRPHNFELAHNLEKMIETRPWRHGWRLSTLQQTASWIKNFSSLSARIFLTERQMHQIANRIFFNSYGDMQFMSSLYGGTVAKDWVIPFLERECIPVKDNKSPLDVIYLSSNYISPTHMSGARWFLDKVIPAVEAAMPCKFRFHVVGPGSTEHLGKYASKTILIHDFVEDLPAFLYNIDVACLPVQIGWGCKIKMLEALATGLPVVGSPQTFRGVPPTPEAYYSCRTTKDFVAAFRSLQDTDTRKRLAIAGRAAYNAWLSDGQRILGEALKAQETAQNQKPSSKLEVMHSTT
jgi:glycosyltransferase involved in cell wall biosynthesis